MNDSIDQGFSRVGSRLECQYEYEEKVYLIFLIQWEERKINFEQQ
jgi:hypothetical protein